MIDLAFVRGNLALVEEKLRARGVDPTTALGDFAAVDRERREAITQVETLKAHRNKLTEEIAKLRREGADTTTQTEQTRTLKARVESLEAAAATADERLHEIMQTLPNLPQDCVPVGKDEHANREEKVWGEQPRFDFTPKPHWELGEALGILDFNRAAKISGSRFVVHFGQGARLERALANFMLDLHTRPVEEKGHGYTEVLPPYMVNSKSLFGTGQLPKFAEDLFHCDDKGPYQPGVYQDSDHWLIPTAEVPVTNLFRDETLDESQLPISYCAYTPCFRSEAGSYGKDVRGMIRQHQFQKVEAPKTQTLNTRPSPAMPKRSLKNSAFPTAACSSAPATWASPPPRPTISKSGCPVSNSTARYPHARTSRHSRPAAATFAIVPQAPKNPSFFTPLTAAASPSAAPISQYSKTTSRPTAPSEFQTSWWST